ncbi:prepilin peptidase [Vibrio sp. RE86]|uniref:primosomal replication protein n=1 Tax=Vibrio sp. RE86 TaxID=2607605 RepID=UPI001493968E|nr:primosomal replication protein [Vibrio sp. RE86]NOH79535.1 prepilin peptidase [Vibrio sp. RE86]
MSKIKQLNSTLDALSIKASSLDEERGKHHLPLFDEQLFQCKATLLVPCVEETQQTLTSLIREEETGKLTPTRAEYLTERLISQIEAIQRELATTKIRRHEPKHNSYYQKPINELYQNLAQHQEWERRLKEMVSEKEHQLKHAPAFQKPTLKNALAATEQRLSRCQESKLRIEKQITYRERNQ